MCMRDCDIDCLFPQFEKDFVSSARADTVESGYVYEFEHIFESYLEKGAVFASKMLFKLLKKHYRDVHIVKAILHAISHYSYRELGDAFVMEILSLCHHENKGVKKFALKVFDNWEAIETLEALKHIAPIEETWIENYRQEIIRHLEHLKEHSIDFCRSGYKQ